MATCVRPHSAAPLTLPVQGPARSLLEAFHASDVRYCHWKSNQHLEDGLIGRTDLDILIDREDRQAVQGMLVEAGFKRFAPTVGMGYPAIEDYIALDETEQRLIHCHLHWRLVAGEAHLKGHRLPWERVVLDTRTWDGAASVFTASADLEMLLLVVRYATKIRWRDRLATLVGRRYIGRGFRDEFEWLRERLDAGRSIDFCRQLLGNAAGDAYARVLDGDVTLAELLSFRAAASVELDESRTYGGTGGRMLRWLREIAWVAAGVNRRWFRSAHPLRRTIPTGGVVITLVGPDGSGKSTVTRAVSSLLSAKLDVLLLYFGSGDGPSSLLRLPLRWARSLMERPHAADGTSGGGSLAQPRTPTASSRLRQPRLRELARAVWAIVLSREKRQTLRTATRARNRGMVVITDRFPQTQFPGFNDGPLLARYRDHPSALLRRLSAWEAGPYERAYRQAPDLVIKMNVDVETALARKPETGRAEVERRLAALRAWQFPPTTRVVEIDANQPLEVVIRLASRAVWAAL